uniref:Uncharacterized protein n=2 Tax=Clastoptera arizonana TaxID=38151 RepID=A0A1B6CZB7_9HEMI
MNGYWTDQQAFAIARAYANQELPAHDSPLYKWPSDLLMPDLIVYLNFPEENQAYYQFATPRSKNWKSKVLNIYRRFSNIPLLEIKTLMGWDHIISVIQRQIIGALSGTCYINFKNITFASFERK